MGRVLGFLALAPTPLSPPTPPAAVELVWEAPQECPTGADVESLYEALLTSDPTGTGVLEAHAVVTRTSRGSWRLELTTRIGDYTDVRKIRGGTCQDLAEATATLFAFALEPALHEPETEPKPPEREPEPEPEPRPEPEPLPESQPSIADIPVETPQPRPRKPRRLFAALSVGPELGGTPSVTARIAAGVGFSWRWARFEADVAWLAPRPTDRLGVEGQVQAVTGLVRGCGLPGGDTWRFPVCAGAEVGGTIARVDRGAGLETLAGPWAGPMLSAAAIRRFDRFGVFLAVEAMGALAQSELQFSDNVIFTPANGSVRVLAGLEIGFF